MPRPARDEPLRAEFDQLRRAVAETPMDGHATPSRASMAAIDRLLKICEYLAVRLDALEQRVDTLQATVHKSLPPQ